MNLRFLAVIALFVGCTGFPCAAADPPSEDHAAAVSHGESHNENAHAASAEEDGHGAAAHDGATHGAGGHGAGAHDDRDFNKVPLIFEPALFVWSLCLFLLYVFLARRIAWLPLIRGLDARESRVNRALHDAEAARIEAERLLAQHDARMEQVQEEVKQIVAQARKEAEAEKARLIAAADAEATALRNQALADIESAHRRALESLDSHIDRQVAAATDHVLGRTA